LPSAFVPAVDALLICPPGEGAETTEQQMIGS
jgi:hypothetical protein